MQVSLRSLILPQTSLDIFSYDPEQQNVCHIWRAFLMFTMHMFKRSEVNESKPNVLIFLTFDVIKWRSKTMTFDGRSNEVMDTKTMPDSENMGHHRGS